MSDVKFITLLSILSLLFFYIIYLKTWKLTKTNFLKFFWGWKMYATWSCLGVYSLGVEKFVNGVFSRGECLFKLQRRKKVLKEWWWCFPAVVKKRVCFFRLSEANLVWRRSLKLQLLLSRLWVRFKLYKLEVKGTFWKSVQQNWVRSSKGFFQVVTSVTLSHLADKWEVFVWKIFCNDFVYH